MGSVLLATWRFMLLILFRIEVPTIFLACGHSMLLKTYIKPVVFCSHVGRTANAQSGLCTTLLI